MLASRFLVRSNCVTSPWLRHANRNVPVRTYAVKPISKRHDRVLPWKGTELDFEGAATQEELQEMKEMEKEIEEDKSIEDDEEPEQYTKITSVYPFQTKYLSFQPERLDDYFDPIQFRAHHITEYDHSVKRLNLLLSRAGSDYSDYSLEDLIKADIPKITDLACHVANHNLFFDCLGLSAHKYPRGKLRDFIERDFGSYDNFKKLFKEEAMNLFGSGWIFLALQNDGHLAIVTTEIGGNPIQLGMVPLIACDLWEHAYYHDYRNDKGKYVENFLLAVLWDAVDHLFHSHV